VKDSLQPAELDALFRDMEPRLRAALFRDFRTMSHEEADEIIQDAFVDLQAGQARGRTPADPAAWLVRVARNLALKRRRTSRSGPLPSEMADGSRPDPLAAVLQAEKLQVSVDALLALPEEDRKLVVLRDLEGRSFGAIASATGLGEEQARKAYQRARARLSDAGGRYSSSAVQAGRPAEYRPRTRRGALRAIGTLPREYADALKARYADGVGPEGLPARLGVPAGEAARRLARGEELLARKYGFRLPDDLEALFSGA
jgi:RNA polymerase sigma-70 factor (ECF subfamily)